MYSSLSLSLLSLVLAGLDKSMMPGLCGGREFYWSSCLKLFKFGAITNESSRAFHSTTVLGKN